MADLDTELVERVTRWCADAGRQVAAREIHAALSKLSWDELLALRALLVEPPPARPLGPFALADMARGAPADVAAERERGGRYRAAAEEARLARDAELATGSGKGAPSPAAPSPPPRRARKGARRGAGIVIHRARDRAPPVADAPPTAPDVAELHRPEGRGVLERLVRAHGGRRAAVVAELSRGWRRADGTPAGGEDLSGLLDHHGLTRAFERRERDELLHALRAEGGVRGTAAARLGLDADGLARALERLGAGEAAERIRSERRRDLRARATLSERIHLLLAQEERLRDLELLEEFEADLRARLPEHLRALRAAAGPLDVALARSLSLPADTTSAIATRFGLALAAGGAGAIPGGRREDRPRPRERPAARGAPRERERPGTGAPRSRAGRPDRPGPAGAGARGRAAGGAAPPRGAGGRGGPRTGPRGDARGAAAPRSGPGAAAPARGPSGAGGRSGPRARPRPGGGGRRPPRPR